MSTNRVTKSIKLTDEELLIFQKNSEASSKESFREYCEFVLFSFMENHDNNKGLLLLKPVKSAGYRPIALSSDIANKIKDFAKQVDASANSIIYTAFKNSITDLNEISC